jgi:hypothetical protein
MRAIILAVAAVAALVPIGTVEAQPRSRSGGEQRCGWLANPTPGNYWLTDRQGTWTIREQGPVDGPPGWDNSPDFSTRGWVATNGSYGYGCACMRVDVNRRTMRVTRFYSGRPAPLAQCRRDRSLPRPDA